MSQIYCTKCGAANAQEAAFCGSCGAALAASTPAQPQPPATPGAGWQPVAGGTPPPNTAPPAPEAQAPPAGGYVPPSPGFAPPPPGGYQTPGAFPPPTSSAGVMGENTKWGLGLGIAAFFCCGPFTAIPGIYMSKKDMDEIASGRAPHLNQGYAKAAYYLNIIALVIWVASVCLFWGRLGMFRRF